jgi:mRNA-degrading endonuclease RelE of RelBE toxin-antitoxin system
MPKYSCERCGKEFNQKCHYNDHINRKIPCPPKSTEHPPKSTKIKHIMEKSKISCENVCNYCGGTFSRSDALVRHLNSRCKVKKANDAKMEELMLMLIELKENNKKIIEENKENNKKLEEKFGKEIEELRKENAQYKKIINNTQNNIRDSTININITPYGQEDLSYITKKDYQKIFSRANMSVPAFVEQIHFNKNKPENHNVYISNMRADYGLLYDGNQWAIHNKEDLLDNMYEDKTVILLDQFEQQYDSLDEPTKKMFERFVKRHEEDV